jgi:two-component system response regulator VicR
MNYGEKREEIQMSKKIMVVDDEPDTVDLVKLVLEIEGFEVMTAYSGKECLGKLKEEKPDGVLLDIMMPGMDGWEVFKKIRERYKDLPVAMLTVKNQDIDKMLGLHVLKAEDYPNRNIGNHLRSNNKNR